jgi:hypothetical protein
MSFLKLDEDNNYKYLNSTEETEEENSRTVEGEGTERDKLEEEGIPMKSQERREIIHNIPQPS